VVKRVRFGICVLVVALAAIFAPSALSGGVTTVSIGTSAGNGSGTVQGDASVAPFGFIPGFFSCSVTPTSAVPLGFFGDCGPDGFNVGDSFYVFATASPGSVFTGWQGCPGTVNLPTRSCAFTVGFGAPPTVVLRPVFTSNVNVTGTKTGQGTFVSATGAFNCGANCSTQTVSLPAGSVVQITATPASGWVIADWGGACNAVASSSTVCTFTVSAANNTFSVTFTQIFTLTIDVNGSGTVTVNPGNVTCPPTCTANVVGGTVLTFTATAASGNHLVGFGGPCSGTTCTFTMTQATTLSVNFAPNAVQANVNSRFVTYNGPSGRERVINTKITAQEQITVDITIRRGGTTVAARTFTMNGVRTLRVFLRDNLPSGSYTVIVEMENQAGLTKQAPNRSVRVQAV
jgi:hypothetical protein